MELSDVVKFQLKRENPFPGLVIDADTWRDAHAYHRDQQRLHLLAFHSTGILGGLEVNANNPPDLSVTIQPGIAIDPDGHTVIVPQVQRYKLQTTEKGTLYLIIQFREVPTEPYQPPDGGQPTRIIEGYRIQERDKLPDEPYLELARIDFDPAEGAVTNPKNPTKPGKNEIDFRHRRGAGVAPTPQRPAQPPPPAPAPAPQPKMPEKPAAKTESPAPPPPPPPPSKASITIGHMALGEDRKDLHLTGLENLVREVGGLTNSIDFNIKRVGSPAKDTKGCDILYMTGTARFDLSQEDQGALADFLKGGGTIFGEGCAEGQGEGQSKGTKEFGLAFNQLATQLNCKLEAVQRGHALLTSAHIFSQVPEGAEPGMLLEGGRMIYSASDYGCAWQGGHQDTPLGRDAIRNSVEMGTNVIAFARQGKQKS